MSDDWELRNPPYQDWHDAAGSRTWPKHADPTPPPRKKTGRKVFLWVAAGVVVLAVASAISTGDDHTGAVPNGAATSTAPGHHTTAAAAGLPKGVHHFGDVVRFKDGSTLTVSKPVEFDRKGTDFGGADAAHPVKFRATFHNGSGKVFDPSLSTASMSSADVEAGAIYGDRFDSPDTRLLPGHTVTWWEGYGAKSATRWTVEVSVGFLDYPTVIFTNEA
jgi:hypothetical protein